MRFGIALALLALSGCGHNHPIVDRPNSVTEAAQARVYTDINGSLYPANWQSPDVVGKRAVRRRHSIYGALGGDEDRIAVVHAAEEEHLREIARLAAQSRRVFIFMVGFNTNQPNTAVELRAMQDRIGLRPDDLAIEFYWDGYDAAAYVDAARIWFWGTGSSQVAGERGLRRVLNRVGERETIIVTYSRGASVALSALSRPSYSEGFIRKTSRFPHLRPAGRAFFDNPPLAEGGPIRLVMLAAAIGEPDFWRPLAEGEPAKAPRQFRDFPERVKSIRYAINGRDMVLTKGDIGLADNFNATDLGAYADAARRLRCHYGILLQGYPVANRFGHGVQAYIADPSFPEMMLDSGVAVRGFPAPVGPAPIVPPEVCPPTNLKGR